MSEKLTEQQKLSIVSAFRQSAVLRIKKQNDIPLEIERILNVFGQELLDNCKDNIISFKVASTLLNNGINNVYLAISGSEYHPPDLKCPLLTVCYNPLNDQIEIVCGNEKEPKKYNYAQVEDCLAQTLADALVASLEHRSISQYVYTIAPETFKKC